MTDWKATDDEKKSFNDWYGKGAPRQGATDTGGDGGWLGSVGAGFKGAAKELAGDVGVASDWAKSDDPAHSTAEWVGRKAADYAPIVGLDIAAPELAPIAGAGRVAKLTNAAINAGVKGGIGGAAMQPKDITRGGETGAEVGTVGGLTRAGWSMLPGWAKYAAFTAPGSLAALASVVHEMGGRTPYVSPWATHHIMSALAGLAAAAAKAPATTGAIGSDVQNTLSPEQ